MQYIGVLLSLTFFKQPYFPCLNVLEFFLLGSGDAVISDTDSEEETGYDSDVEREKNIDYTSKIYTSPLRELGTEAIKPQEQSTTEVKQKYYFIMPKIDCRFFMFSLRR